MKKFSSVFSCFHTDIMNKYIFPVQQKVSGNFTENFLEIFRNIFFRKSYITTTCNGFYSVRIALILQPLQWMPRLKVPVHSQCEPEIEIFQKIHPDDPGGIVRKNMGRFGFL